MRSRMRDCSYSWAELAFMRCPTQQHGRRALGSHRPCQIVRLVPYLPVVVAGGVVPVVAAGAAPVVAAGAEPVVAAGAVPPVVVVVAGGVVPVVVVVAAGVASSPSLLPQPITAVNTIPARSRLINFF